MTECYIYILFTRLFSFFLKKKREVVSARLSLRSIDVTRNDIMRGNGLSTFNNFIIWWTIAMVALKATHTILILTLGTIF